MDGALQSYVTASIAIVGITVSLAVALSFAARRAGAGRVLGPVELVARLPLEPRRTVYVVRIADQVLVLGSSDAGLIKLGELPEGALDAERPAPVAGALSSRFAAVVAAMATRTEPAAGQVPEPAAGPPPPAPRARSPRQ